MGLLAIALIVVGVLSMTGSMANMNMGTMSADKLSGFLGLGVAAFGLLKFIFVLTNSPGWAAFVGLVLLVAIGYGRLAEGAVERRLPDGRPRRDDGRRRDASAQQPTAERRHAAERATAERAADRSPPPPSGGMPPSGSSDM